MLYEKNELFITNSLSGKRELFMPLNKGYVGMYVCGPTVYSYVHLGNCRTFISFDMMFRYFHHLGYKVRYVRNITDAGHLENDADEGEDKIAKKARLEKLEPMEIVQRYTIYFHSILGLFNCLPPSMEPTATGHITEQIEIIKKLLKGGWAYLVNGSVYFDVEKYNSENPKGKGTYGELSGRKTEDLISGTRELDGQDEKRSALDFALWKKASPSHIMRWPSPWGDGFPGWHLECSAMSGKYLGEEFDIHGGGMDLKFPHHECEIAQNTACTGHRGSRYWVHANMLTLNGKRMSKSTGNTLNPDELFSGNNPVLSKPFSPAVVRFFMMQAHYASVLDFSSDALEAAEKGYTRLWDAVSKTEGLKTSAESSFDYRVWQKRCYDAMNDDFNTPVLLSHIFEAVSEINKISDGKAAISKEDRALLQNSLKAFIEDIMGITPPEKAGNTGLIDTLVSYFISEREFAKTSKDYVRADSIRKFLHEAGVELKDTKDGTTYTLS